MDFELSPTAQELQGRLLDFMDSHVYPAEQVYRDQMAASGDPHHHPPVIDVLKADSLVGAGKRTTTFIARRDRTSKPGLWNK